MAYSRIDLFICKKCNFKSENGQPKYNYVTVCGEKLKSEPIGYSKEFCDNCGSKDIRSII